MKLLRAGCTTLLALGLQACASVVSDAGSTTYIETDPENARCELHGRDFKRVVTTPNICETAVREASAKRDKEIKELEERRMRARVAGNTAASGA